MGAKDEEQRRRVGAVALDYVGDSARFSLDLYNSVNKISNGSPGMFNFLGNASIAGVGRLLAPPAPAQDLGKPADAAITAALERTFLDRVISGLGLVVTLYDVLSIGEGFVTHSDGGAHYRCVARLAGNWAGPPPDATAVFVRPA